MRHGEPPSDTTSQPSSPYGPPSPYGPGPTSNGSGPSNRYGPGPVEGEPNGPGPAISTAPPPLRSNSNANAVNSAGANFGSNSSGRRPGPPPIHIEPRSHTGPPPGAVGAIGARRGGTGPSRDHPQRFRQQDDNADLGGLQPMPSEPQFRSPHWGGSGSGDDDDVQHSNFAAPRQYQNGSPFQNQGQFQGGNGNGGYHPRSPPTPDSANWPLPANPVQEPLASPTFPNAAGSTPRTPQSGKFGGGMGMEDPSAYPAPLNPPPIHRTKTNPDRSHSPMAMTKPLDGDPRYHRQEGQRPPPRPPHGEYGMRAQNGAADDFGAGFI